MHIRGRPAKLTRHATRLALQEIQHLPCTINMLKSPFKHQSFKCVTVSPKGPDHLKSLNICVFCFCAGQSVLK